MNVLLIYPCCPESEVGFWPPLGFGYISAVLLENGHDVRILNRDILLRKYHRMEKVDELTKKEIGEFKPSFVGISATTPLIPDSYHIVSIVRKIDPKIKTVLGGTHPTILPEQTLKDCNDVDVVVIGEGEITMKDLIENKDLKDISGIAFRKNEKIIINPQKEIIDDLDQLPNPARQLLDMDFYLHYNPGLIRGIETRGTHIFTSRGCPYNCAFCAGAVAFGRKMRFHSVEYVISEIKDILKKYPKVSAFYFADDMFLANKKRAEELCKILIEEKLNKKIIWAAQMRANIVDAKILALLKKAGCVQVEYGFESGSQRVLNLMNKNCTVEQNYNAAKITKEAGIRILADIIVGFPGEKKEDLEQTFKFLKDTKPEYIGFNRFTPLPGSKVFNELKNKGLIDPDWRTFHVANATNFTEMSDKEYDELCYKFEKEFVIPSNHANYFRYNIKNHPIRMFPTLVSKFRQNWKETTKRILTLSIDCIRRKV